MLSSKVVHPQTSQLLKDASEKLRVIGEPAWIPSSATKLEQVEQSQREEIYVDSQEDVVVTYPVSLPSRQSKRAIPETPPPILNLSLSAQIECVKRQRTDLTIQLTEIDAKLKSLENLVRIQDQKQESIPRIQALLDGNVTFPICADSLSQVLASEDFCTIEAMSQLEVPTLIALVISKLHIPISFGQAQKIVHALRQWRE